MKSRDQIRARNALAAIEGGKAYRGIQGGDALSRFPALIINNGLLATLAFSQSRKGDYIAICDAIARHLADADIDLVNEESTSLDRLLRELSEADAALLRACTAETLAYLNFLRRFAKGTPKRNAGGQ